jgi:hypothetical protein
MPQQTLTCPVVWALRVWKIREMEEARMNEAGKEEIRNAVAVGPAKSQRHLKGSKGQRSAAEISFFKTIWMIQKV